MTDKTIENILLALQGHLVVNPWGDKVPNLFKEGLPCERLYEEVYQANRRLCERLGSGEADDDVEIIINSLLNIGDIQATEMFRCGWNFARESIEELS